VSPALGGRDRRLLRRARRIVGIDEVGRGALAGPVVVCGAAWTTIPDNPSIQDSKTVPPRRREEAAAWVKASCADWAVVEIWPGLIDSLNILGATRLAMRAVAARLAGDGAVVVVDAVPLETAGVEVLAEAGADARYFSVAAASIVAKVHRDRLMTRLAARHGSWAWEKNKGYGTRDHRLALTAVGSSFLHRKSFCWRPVLP